MTEYFASLFGPEVMDLAMYEFWPAMEPIPTEEDIQRQMPLFIPWMIFNWPVKPTGPSKKIKGLKGKTIAEIYLRDQPVRLDSLEQRVIEASNRVPYRFFEVIQVDPGRGVYLRDVLTAKDHNVQERSGSQHMHPGDLLFGRVAAIDEVNMLIGLAPYHIPPSFKVGLIKLRNVLKAGKPEVTESDIAAAEVEIRHAYFEIDHRLYHPPTICNTDGHLLEPHKMIFQIDSPKTVLTKLASLSVIESQEEILQNAHYHKDGSLQRADWDWNRLGHKQSPGMSNTILGNLLIEGNKLTVEVNSAERAQKIRRMIENRLGSRVRFKMDEITPFRPEEALASRKTGRSQKSSSHESLMQDPEVQQYLAETIRAHWEGWVDMKIPALGNRTPREAIRTADGREAVEGLLIDFEQDKGIQPELEELNRQGFGGSGNCWNYPKRYRPEVLSTKK